MPETYWARRARVVLSLMFCLGYLVSLPVPAQEVSPGRALEVRDRYEQVLLRDPYHEQAFDRVYDTYLTFEGVEAWAEKLASLRSDAPNEGMRAACTVLLARVRERQFKPEDALALLEEVQAGEPSPELHRLMGMLCHQTGRDEGALRHLSAFLDSTKDPGERAEVCRVLGAVHMRQGNREEAVEAWRALVEETPTDIYAFEELAAIYEENRMWPEAIEAYQRIRELASNDPYRQCRALRSTGDCYLRQDEHEKAIATYEEAFELVAPGNWLFEDLKGRLVSVYADLGDLEGLAAYLTQRLEAGAGLEFRELLAETCSRLGRVDEAVAHYRGILERDPARIQAYERLIGLLNRQGEDEAVVELYEDLIRLFPSEPDYVRRLGEHYLNANQPEKAQETWQRILKEDAAPSAYALLAQWYQDYGFLEEAVAAYRKAVGKRPDKEWVFRLAGLLHEQGEEEQAVAAWESVLGPDAGAAEFAEVAGILDSYGLTGKAGEMYAKAAGMAPDNLEYQLALATNRVRREQHEQALPLFELLAGQDGNAYFRERGERGLLDAYAALGTLDQKRAEWEQTLQDEPKNVEVITRLARAYDRLGDRARVIDLLENAHEVEPDEPDHLRALAQAYQRARRGQDAIKAYEQLIEADPNRARAYLRDLLTVYLAVNASDKATAAARRIVELAPSDAEGRATLAEVYMMSGQEEEALTEYRRAMQLDPDEVKYMQAYGSSLMRQGRWGESQQVFRNVLDAAQEEDVRLETVRTLTQIYQRLDRLAELRHEFEGRVRTAPKRAAGYRELAAFHQALGRQTEALETLESGLENVEDRVQMLTWLIRMAYDAGDYERVVAYYEQLLEQMAEPGLYEYERLGRAYAQLGRPEEAREAWAKMVERNPGDPGAYKALAETLEREGMLEEAVQATERALELDPYDYEFRYDYAQALAVNGEVDRALSQLETLLELGEGPENTGDEASKPAPSYASGLQGVARVQRTQQLNPYMFTGQSGPRYHQSRRWRGSFEDFRPDVVRMMAYMAQGEGDVERVVSRFEERVEQNPADVQAKRDLLTVYQTLNRWDAALEQVEALLTDQQDDLALLEQLAMIHGARNEYGQAAAVLETVLDRDPSRKKEIWRVLAHLYSTQKNEAKLDAVVEKLLDAYPDDYSVLMQVAQVYMQQGDEERLTGLYAKIGALPPQQRLHATVNFAQWLRRAGNGEQANALFEEMLFSAEHSDAAQQPGPVANVYVIQAESVRQSTGGGMRQLASRLGNVFSVEHARVAAFTDLMTSSSDEERAAIVARMEAAVEHYPELTGSAEKEQVWDLGKLLGVYYLSEGRLDDAGALLKHFEEGGLKGTELTNCRLILSEFREDYAGLAEKYEELAQRNPGQASNIERGRMVALAKAGDKEKALEAARAFVQGRHQTNAILAVLRNLRGVLGDANVQELLEGYLAGPNRNTEAVKYLAEVCAAQGEHEKAYELAREAWEQQGRGSSVGWRPSYYSPHYRSHHRMHATHLLNQLRQYAQAAGRLDELTEELEQRAENQPGSVQVHVDLGELYGMTGRQDEQIEVYETLAERRPQDTSVKMKLAELYANNQRVNEAVTVYEEVLRQRPAMYSSLSWRIRDIYKRTGRGEELAQLEDDVVRRSTNPDELEQMANQFTNDGDHDRAVEVYKRVLRLDPNRIHAYSRMAQAYSRAGDYEQALATYDTWLKRASAVPNSHVDHNTLAQVVGEHAFLGKLDELKQRTAKMLEASPKDKLALMLKAQIDLYEHRMDEGTRILEDLLVERNDQNVFYPLVQVLEMQGRDEEIVALIKEMEKRSAHVDYDSLARAYLRLGETDKAVEAAMKQALQQGAHAHYELVSLIRRLRDWGLVEQAEAVYREHKDTIESDTNARQQAGYVLAEMYVEQGAFAEFVEPKLAEPAPGDLELLKRIAQRSHSSGLVRLRAARALREAGADNTDALREAAQHFHNLNHRQEAIETYQQLAELQPGNTEWRKQVANGLVQLGREQEAVDYLTTWVRVEPKAERVRVLADLLKTSQRYGTMQKLAEELAGTAKAEALKALKPPELKASDSPAQQGQSLDELKAAFEEDPNESTFAAYFRVLVDTVPAKEAYELYKQHKDAQWMRTMIQPNNNPLGDRLARVCAQHGDIDVLVETAWSGLETGEEWRRSQSLYPFRHACEREGRLKDFVEALHERAAAEDLDDAGLKALAQFYQQVNEQDRALALHDRIVERNPRNRDALKQKAQLLTQLGRHEEALELLRSLPPARTLNEQRSDRLDLARAYARAGRQEDAQKVLDELLAWSAESQTYEMLGSMYSEAGQWEKAAEAYEKAAADPQRRHNVRGLVRCYGELGRTEDLLALYREYPQHADPYQIMRTLADTCPHDELKEALGFLLRSNWHHFHALREVVSKYRERGGVEDAVDLVLYAAGLFEDLREGVPRNAHDPVKNELQNLARELAETPGPAVSALLERESFEGDAVALRFAGHLAEQCAQRRHEGAVHEIAARLDDVESVEPGAARLLGVAMQHIDEKEQAREWYLRAAGPEATQLDKEAALNGLLEMGQEEAAERLLTDVLQSHPSLFATDQRIQQALASSESAELQDLLARLVPEFTASPERKAYYETLLSFQRNPSDEAAQALARLAVSGELTRKELQSIVTLFESESKRDTLLDVVRFVVADAEDRQFREQMRPELARLLLENGEVDGALEQYHAAQLNRHSVHMWAGTFHLLGRELASQGRWDAMDEIGRDLCERFPDVWGIWSSQWGRLYAEHGRRDAWLGIVETLAEEGVQAHHFEPVTRELEQAGYWQAAVEMTEKLKNRVGNNYWVYFRWAEMLMRFGRLEEAYALTLEGLRTPNGIGHARNPHTCSQIAGLAVALGNTDELRELSNTWPEDMRNLFAAFAAAHEGRFSEAYDLAVPLLDDRQRGQEVVPFLARWAERAGRQDEAYDAIAASGKLDYLMRHATHEWVRMYGVRQDGAHPVSSFDQEWGDTNFAVSVASRLLEHGFWDAAVSMYSSVPHEEARKAIALRMATYFGAGTPVDAPVVDALTAGPPAAAHALAERLASGSGQRRDVVLETLRRAAEARSDDKVMQAEWLRAGPAPDDMVERCRELASAETPRTVEVCVPLLLAAGYEREAVKLTRAFLDAEFGYHEARQAAQWLSDAGHLTMMRELRERARRELRGHERDACEQYCRERFGAAGMLQPDSEAGSRGRAEAAAAPLRPDMLERAARLLLEGDRAARVGLSRSDSAVCLELMRGVLSPDEAAKVYLDMLSAGHHDATLKQSFGMCDAPEAAAIAQAIADEAALREDLSPPARDKSASALLELGEPAGALAIYDGLMADWPWNQDFCRGKLSALKALERWDEAAAFIESLGPLTTFEARRNARVELARALFMAGREQAGEAGMAALREWTKDADTVYETAAVYADAGRCEPALALLDEAGPAANLRGRASALRCRCYANLGQHEQMVAAWREAMVFPGAGVALPDDLLREGLVDAAERLAREAGNVVLLAKCARERGEEDAHLSLFAQGYGELAAPRQWDRARQYGKLIGDEGLLEELLAGQGTVDEPALRDGLIAALARTDKDKREVPANLAQLAANRLKPDTLQAQLALAGALLGLGADASAAEWFQTASKHPACRPADRKRVVAGLAELNDCAAAVPVLRALLETTPSVAMTDAGVWKVAAKSGGAALRDAAMAALREVSPYESHYAWAEAVFAHYAQPGPDTLDALTAAVEGEHMLRQQVEAAAELLEASGRKEAAESAYARLR